MRTTAHCKRCTISFCYFRRGRHRYYCEPCREQERKDANDFFNAYYAARRKSEREMNDA